MKYLYPKYHNYLLSYNRHPENLPLIKLYNNFEKNKLIISVEEKHDQLSKKNKEYTDYLKENLTDNQLSEMDKYKLLSFTFNNNIYKEEKYNITIGWSNAWRKIYEICKKTKLVPKKNKIKYFDICGFPGSFVLAVNHFLKTEREKTEYDWYIQSYVAEKDSNYFKDSYGLKKKYPERFIYKKNGNITDVEELKYYKNFFKHKKRNMVTSDCGLRRYIDNTYDREKTMTKIFFANYILGTSVLEKGGNFLMKYYNFYKNFNISLLYLMTLNFEKIHILKPESSRQFGGSEIYILCLNYYDNITSNVYNNLLKILKNFTEKDIDKSLISFSFINKNLLESIEEKLYKIFLIQINNNIKKWKLTDDLIDIDPTVSFEKYVKKQKYIFQKARKLENKYFKMYFEKMDYKKIKNKDKLI